MSTLATEVPVARTTFRIVPRYLAAMVMPISALVSVSAPGAWTFLSFGFTFGLVPVLEAILRGTPRNLSEAEEEDALANRFFDVLAALNAPLMVVILVLFLQRAASPATTPVELVGCTLSVGVMSAILGTNVGHELGHRPGRVVQALSWVLLASTLNLHFLVYHNRWHHKWVATPHDPASARRDESLYAFWVRSMTGNWIGSWRIEADRLRRAGRSPLSVHNRMLVGQLVQVTIVAGVGAVWGLQALAAFLGASLLGHLIYEAGNYIEHYGMVRRELRPGVYERAQPTHSWNSNHVLGRVMLYELSRHSDHHFLPSRKYQVLRHFDQSPQLPFGYPTAILAAAVPPLWFRLINPRLPAA